MSLIIFLPQQNATDNLFRGLFRTRQVTRATHHTKASPELK